MQGILGGNNKTLRNAKLHCWPDEWLRHRLVWPVAFAGLPAMAVDNALLCKAGHLEVDLPDGSSKTFGITRAHMEEDSGGALAGASNCMLTLSIHCSAL